MNNDESKEAPSNELRCDYLWSAPARRDGVRRYFTHRGPDVPRGVVDRRAKAGGHWVDSTRSSASTSRPITG